MNTIADSINVNSGVCLFYYELRYLSFYQNPTSDQVTVSAHDAIINSVSIMDMSGKVLRTENLKMPVLLYILQT
ncbi:hypothetical protein OKW96_16080 [Sphingobacterium sp. KU25419]|nr:hypothetical protein OKW96_16080 [Sphingobacterium sp. KU25419]